jgi:lipid-A-disaccharide synthase
MAHTIPRSLVEKVVDCSRVPLTMTEGNSRKVLAVSDVALVASGTATLEAFLLGVPQVVAYRSSWLNFFVGRRIIRIPWVSLPNILTGRAIVEEYLQEDVKPEKLARAILELLRNETWRRDYQRAGKAVLESLKGGEASRLAARTILETLDAWQKEVLA